MARDTGLAQVPDGRARRPGARPAAAALLAYLLLTLAVTWPLPARICSAVPGDLADPLFYSTVLWWDCTRLAALDFSNYFSPPFGHPFPYSLAYSNHGTGLALPALPLWLLLREPLPVYNLLTLAAFPFSAFAAFLLARRLTGSSAGAFLAGLIYAFAPFRLLRLGHLEVLHAWGIPLAMLALLSLLERPRTGAAAGLALMVAWAALVNLYFLVHLALLLPLALLVLAPRYPGWRTTRFWLLTIMAGLAVIAALLPFLQPYRILRETMGFDRAVGETVAPHGLLNYCGVPSTNLLWGGVLGRFDMAEGALFCGASAMALAALGALTAMRAPRGRALALLLAGVGLLLTAGPLLNGGFIADVLGAPYRLLHQWFPGFSGTRVATRWHAVTLLGLGCLAAAGWSNIARRLTAALARPALAAVALLLAAEYYQPAALCDFPGPLQRPKLVERLRDLPAGAVAQLPMQWFNNLALYHLTVHGHPVVQGVVAHEAPLREEMQAMAPGDPRLLALLRSMGVRYVIVSSAADTDGSFRIACAASPRLHWLAADEYGALFELKETLPRLLAWPADCSDLTGERLPDGSVLVSCALAGDTASPAIALQRYAAAELTLLHGGSVRRRETVRLELPPYSTGTQRAAALVADAAGVDEVRMLLTGRELRGPVR